MPDAFDKRHRHPNKETLPAQAVLYRAVEPRSCLPAGIRPQTMMNLCLVCDQVTIYQPLSTLPRASQIQQREKLYKMQGQSGKDRDTTCSVLQVGPYFSSTFYVP